MNKNIITIGSIVAVAVLGTIFTQLGLNWFESLAKPSQWVPQFIFPIVWTTIYLIFGYVLIKQQKSEKLPQKTIILLIINGVLNVLWCLCFFTLHLTLVGNIVIIINTIFAYLLWQDILKTSTLHGWLVFIYAIWLSLATSLNTAVWILN